MPYTSSPRASASAPGGEQSPPPSAIRATNHRVWTLAARIESGVAQPAATRSSAWRATFAQLQRGAGFHESKLQRAPPTAATTRHSRSRLLPVAAAQRAAHQTAGQRASRRQGPTPGNVSNQAAASRAAADAATSSSSKKNVRTYVRTPYVRALELGEQRAGRRRGAHCVGNSPMTVRVSIWPCRAPRRRSSSGPPSACCSSFFCRLSPARTSAARSPPSSASPPAASDRSTLLRDKADRAPSASDATCFSTAISHAHRAERGASCLLSQTQQALRLALALADARLEREVALAKPRAASCSLAAGRACTRGASIPRAPSDACRAAEARSAARAASRRRRAAAPDAIHRARQQARARARRRSRAEAAAAQAGGGRSPTSARCRLPNRAPGGGACLRASTTLFVGARLNRKGHSAPLHALGSSRSAHFFLRRRAQAAASTVALASPSPAPSPRMASTRCRRGRARRRLRHKTRSRPRARAALPRCLAPRRCQTSSSARSRHADGLFRMRALKNTAAASTPPLFSSSHYTHRPTLLQRDGIGRRWRRRRPRRRRGCRGRRRRRARARQ